MNKYIKRCSTLLAIQEMQIKMIKYCFISITWHKYGQVCQAIIIRIVGTRVNWSTLFKEQVSNIE